MISRRGEYLGGVIAGGISISIEALFSKTARLPMVDFHAPAKLIGTNTVAAIQSGLYYGALGMIDGIIQRLMAELGPDTRCLAIGGQAPLIVRGSRYLKESDENLTLEGLQLIAVRGLQRFQQLPGIQPGIPQNAFHHLGVKRAAGIGGNGDPPSRRVTIDLVAVTLPRKGGTRTFPARESRRPP